MSTTTVRVDAATHQKLVTLAAAEGTSLIEVMRLAADALERVRFARTVADELAVLRGDEQGWADYLGEAEATHVTDGTS
jgi:hypothetical protein